MTQDFTQYELDPIDPSFVFDFEAYDDIDDSTQRWSTWFDVEALCRGPEPRPDWVVTSRGAVDTELGILKTGKEADVFLVERADPADPGGGVVMAAKRYRSNEHRNFHRAATYTEGRSTKRSRDERALKRKSTWGKVVASGEWAVSGRCGSSRSTRKTSASLPVLRTPSSVSTAPLEVTTQSGRGSGPRMRASRSSQRDHR